MPASGFRYLQIGLLLLVLLDFQSIAAQQYRIAHCIMGCPVGAPSDSHLIIRPIYALSFNMTTKSADWVAYRVSAGAIGIASSLSRQAQADHYVAGTLAASDFLDAESRGLGRAQYVPLVDFAATPFWSDVNYLSNSVARSGSLSQGAWYGLDWAIRNMVNRQGDAYVLAGPVYYENPVSPQLPTATPHRVPDAFFKIVITERDGIAVFLLDKATAVHVHHCNLRSDLSEIQSLTGLEFFPETTQPLQNSAYGLLGCS